MTASCNLTYSSSTLCMSVIVYLHVSFLLLRSLCSNVCTYVAMHAPVYQCVSLCRNVCPFVALHIPVCVSLCVLV